jgi:hypothetical protein
MNVAATTLMMDSSASESTAVEPVVEVADVLGAEQHDADDHERSAARRRSRPLPVDGCDVLPGLHARAATLACGVAPPP